MALAWSPYLDEIIPPNVIYYDEVPRVFLMYKFKYFLNPELGAS